MNTSCNLAELCRNDGFYPENNIPDVFPKTSRQRWSGWSYYIAGKERMQEKRGYLTILLSAVLYRFLQKAFSQKIQIHLLTKRRLSYILFRKKRNQHGILPVWLYPAIIFCTSRRTADKPLNRPAERKIRPAQLDKSRMGQQIALRQTAVISYQKDKAVPGRYFYSENQGK